MKQLFLSLLSLVVLTGPVQAQQGWRVEGSWIPWKLEGGEQVTPPF